MASVHSLEAVNVRLDNVEKQLEELGAQMRTVTDTVARIEERAKNEADKLAELTQAVKALTVKPAQRWDALGGALIAAIVAGIVAWILRGVLP